LTLRGDNIAIAIVIAIAITAAVSPVVTAEEIAH